MQRFFNNWAVYRFVWREKWALYLPHSLLSEQVSEKVVVFD